MNAFIPSNIFFIISSIGFVLLWILVAIFLFYLIRATKTFSRIINKLEKDINQIGDVTKEMIEEVRDSTIFHLLFHKKKKSKQK
jgi:uncharacterized membrane protein YciS (DUF1049 family)